jgi:hypothetical protein
MVGITTVVLIAAWPVWLDTASSVSLWPTPVAALLPSRGRALICVLMGVWVVFSYASGDV